MKRAMRRMIAALICALMLGAVVSAADKEATLDCTYIPITSDGFVADTFCGVEARYNLTGPTYFCSELVERFYREVYVLNVITSDGTITVSGSKGLVFVRTDTPAPGDIAYASGPARGSAYNHYALVKSVDPARQTVTLFEQNWGWDGKAGINRVIPYDGGCYDFFTLSGPGSEAYTLSAFDAQSASPDSAAQEPARSAPAADDSEPATDAAPLSWLMEPPAPAAAAPVPTESWLPDAASGTPSGWAQGYVDKARALGILSGVEGDFHQAIDRTALARLACNTARALHLISAVGDPVETIQSLRVMLPNTDGTFDRTSMVSRQMAATVLLRLERLRGDSMQADETFLSRYADWADIADWAREAAAVMTQRGLMNGTTVGFEPRSSMTLEQAVTLLVRICGEG